MSSTFAELQLPDAFSFCLLVRHRGQQRYDRAAPCAGWARFCDEEVGVNVDEAALGANLRGANISVLPAYLSIPALGQKLLQRKRRAPG